MPKGPGVSGLPVVVRMSSVPSRFQWTPSCEVSSCAWSLRPFGEHVVRVAVLDDHHVFDPMVAAAADCRAARVQCSPSGEVA